MADALAGHQGPLLFLGGTFDPLHFGHLRPAEEVRQALGLDRVWLVPAGDPPHRETPGATGPERLAMVETAVAEYPTLGVLDWEVTSEGPSYTVRTLGWLRERLGREPVITIMGSDAFVGLDRWYRWEELLERGHVAVVRRPGADLAGMSPELEAALAGRWCEEPADLLTAPAGRVAVLEVTRLDVSATAIRGLVAAGRSPRFLAPESVESHIWAHGLYSD